MPRTPSPDKALPKKWNLYVNEADKAEYLLALVKNGKASCQSAAVRAFMWLYVHDPEIQEKINKIVDSFLVYKDHGDVSQM